MKAIAFCICILSAPVFASEHTAVMSHYLCSADAAYEPIARAMGKGQGQAVYQAAQKCLEEKLPAALAEAGSNADLKTAIKSWHAKEMTLMRSPDDRLVEKDAREAESVLEMEAKAAGVWDQGGAAHGKKAAMLDVDGQR